MGGLGAVRSGGKIRKTHLQKPVRDIFKVGESITEFQAIRPDSGKLGTLLRREQDIAFHLGNSQRSLGVAVEPVRTSEICFGCC